MRVLRTAILSLLLVCGGCCATGDIIRADYVAGDRATYDAVADEYLTYVEGDEALDDEKKARRKMTITTWRMRLEQGEKPINAGGE